MFDKLVVFTFYFRTPGYPWALEVYYQIGEIVEPENRIREYDLNIWQKQGSWDNNCD